MLTVLVIKLVIIAIYLAWAGKKQPHHQTA